MPANKVLEGRAHLFTVTAQLQPAKKKKKKSCRRYLQALITVSPIRHEAPKGTSQKQAVTFSMDQATKYGN